MGRARRKEAGATSRRDEEYDEVEAVVRIPKGERLADSRRTEGWKRGFTPKSAGKGPGHVEIRLKDHGDSLPPEQPVVNYAPEYLGAPRPAELGVVEQAVADFLSQVIAGLIDAAKPLVVYWWTAHAIPAMRTKAEDFLVKRRARKTRRVRAAGATSATLIAERAAADDASPQQAVTAPLGPKITMTSEQFQHLFMTWLAREDAQQALWEAIANAHIKDADGATLAWRQGLSELSPRQRAERVTEIISVNPSILDDLGRHLMAHGPLELSARSAPARG